jgi:hypothetical protein
MAASVAVAPVVAGAPRRVEVATVTPHAVYLATGDPECPALCLVDRQAVRVPCALLVDAVPGLAVGTTGTAGAGALALPGFTGRVARWLRPLRPRRAAPIRGVWARPDPVLVDLTRALADGRPPDPYVLRLLGRGPGLTPLGDDLLAGLLVTLSARGCAAFEPAAAAVRAHAPSRTTFVSAALLHHAARGECVPELAAFLDGGPVGALLRVGHTSGTGLARGALAGLGVLP